MNNKKSIYNQVIKLSRSIDTSEESLTSPLRTLFHNLQQFLSFYREDLTGLFGIEVKMALLKPSFICDDDEKLLVFDSWIEARKYAVSKDLENKKHITSWEIKELKLNQLI
jgi:hypothetical protein